MSSLSALRDQADSGGDPSPATDQQSALPNYYCLANTHDPRMLTENRFFYWDPADPGCPTCPVCNRQVQAQSLSYNAKGQPVIPANLLALADRIGEQV